MSNPDMPLLGGIAALMRWLEELIIILSAPLLMFGLVVALVDLLTDGSLSLAVPWLITAWAVSQAVGVEANMSGAAFKMRASWKQGAWFAVLGYLALVLALAGVAVVAGYAYAYHQSQGVAIPQTLRDLGIDAASWTFVRSILSVALVILSGLLRYTGEKAKAQDEAQRLREEAELAPLRAQVAALKAVGLRQVASAMIKGAPAPPSQPMIAQDFTQEYGADNQTPYGPVPWGSDLRAVSGPSIHLVPPPAAPVRTPRRRTPKRTPRGAASWERQAREAWAIGYRTVGSMKAHVQDGDKRMSQGAAQYWVGVFKGEARGEERGRQEA
jgi:hypothetical protein